MTSNYIVSQFSSKPQQRSQFNSDRHGRARDRSRSPLPRTARHRDHRADSRSPPTHRPPSRQHRWNNVNSQRQKSPQSHHRTTPGGQSLEDSNHYLSEPPTEFQPSSRYYDQREVYGLNLPRFVQPTSWSRSKHIHGLDITNVPLLSLLYRGWDNHCIRSLAHGYFTGIVTCRSIKEVVFANHILSLIRSSNTDLDLLAEAVSGNRVTSQQQNLTASKHWQSRPGNTCCLRFHQTAPRSTIESSSWRPKT